MALWCKNAFKVETILEDFMWTQWIFGLNFAELPLLGAPANHKLRQLIGPE